MEELIKEGIKILSEIKSTLPDPSWTIAIAIGTVSSAAIALLASFGLIQKLYRPKQIITTGDRINLIISSDRRIHKINLSLAIINQRFYPITVRKIVIKICKENRNYKLNWNLFIKPKLDRRFGLVSVPKNRPAPFVVGARSHKSNEIEFFTDDNILIEEGTYRAKVYIWTEVNNISLGPTERSTFSFEIDNEKLRHYQNVLGSIAENRPVAMFSVQIREWSLGWERNI